MMTCNITLQPDKRLNSRSLLLLLCPTHHCSYRWNFYNEARGWLEPTPAPKCNLTIILHSLNDPDNHFDWYSVNTLHPCLPIKDPLPKCRSISCILSNLPESPARQARSSQYEPDELSVIWLQRPSRTNGRRCASKWQAVVVAAKPPLRHCGLDLRSP